MSLPDRIGFNENHAKSYRMLSADNIVEKMDLEQFLEVCLSCGYTSQAKAKAYAEKVNRPLDIDDLIEVYRLNEEAKGRHRDDFRDIGNVRTTKVYAHTERNGSDGGWNKDNR